MGRGSNKSSLLELSCSWSFIEGGVWSLVGRPAEPSTDDKIRIWDPAGNWKSSDSMLRLPSSSEPSKSTYTELPVCVHTPQPCRQNATHSSRWTMNLRLPLETTGETEKTGRTANATGRGLAIGRRDDTRVGDTMVTHHPDAAPGHRATTEMALRRHARAS